MTLSPRPLYLSPHELHYLTSEAVDIWQKLQPATANNLRHHFMFSMVFQGAIWKAFPEVGARIIRFSEDPFSSTGEILTYPLLNGLCVNERGVWTTAQCIDHIRETIDAGVYPRFKRSDKVVFRHNTYTSECTANFTQGTVHQELADIMTTLYAKKVAHDQARALSETTEQANPRSSVGSSAPRRM